MTAGANEDSTHIIRKNGITQEEFSALVENHADFVYNTVLRIVGNPTGAADVVQEAFVSAYRAKDKFRGDSSVTTWLYRIAVNASLMEMRKARKATRFSFSGYDDLHVEDPSYGPEKAAMNAELQSKIKEGLATLPPSFRTTVVLRDVRQLSTDEAAKALDISIPALKSRLHRGRVLMRNFLAGYVG